MLEVIEVLWKHVDENAVSIYFVKYTFDIYIRNYFLDELELVMREAIRIISADAIVSTEMNPYSLFNLIQYLKIKVA